MQKYEAPRQESVANYESLTDDGLLRELELEKGRLNAVAEKLGGHVETIFKRGLQ